MINEALVEVECSSNATGAISNRFHPPTAQLRDSAHDHDPPFEHPKLFRATCLARRRVPYVKHGCCFDASGMLHDREPRSGDLRGENATLRSASLHLCTGPTVELCTYIYCSARTRVTFSGQEDGPRCAHFQDSPRSKVHFFVRARAQAVISAQGNACVQFSCRV